jgi:hypothetical protein
LYAYISRFSLLSQVPQNGSLKSCTSLINKTKKTKKDRKTGHITAEIETQTTITINQYTTITLPREEANEFTLLTNASLVMSQDFTKKWQTVYTLYMSLASIVQGGIDVTNVQQMKAAFDLKKVDLRLHYLETNSV